MADHRAALQKESLDIQNQYEKDVLACPQPPGGASCRQAAWDRRVASQVQLHLKKSDENARHDKAMVDIDTTYCHPGHAAQQATAPSESSNESSNQGQPPLLKGQISETADDSANAMLHAINSTLDPVGTPLQQLSGFLNTIAPHYDMASRNDTGIKVVGDILVDMGLGHLAGKVPGALRAMVRSGDNVVEGSAKAANKIASQKPAGGKPAGGKPLGSDSGSGLSDKSPVQGSVSTPASGPGWIHLPEGMALPPILKNTPRTLHLQEETHSCVQACIRMVAETVKRMPMREGFLRQSGKWAYKSGEGTGELAIPQLLKDVGIPNPGWRPTTVDEIAAAVKEGYPAIVTYGKAHVSIVDAVVEHGGDRFIFLRNPANPSHWDKLTAEMMDNLGFSNYPVVSEADFLGSFTAGGGKAVFTSP